MLKIYSLKRTHYVSPNNSLSSATVRPAALSFCSVVRIGASEASSTPLAVVTIAGVIGISVKSV
jgi:hypothetical protein